MSKDSPQSDSVNTVVAIATAAAFISIGGAWLGEGWPAAVAVCGLALMGTVVGYFQLRAK